MLAVKPDFGRRQLSGTAFKSSFAVRRENGEGMSWRQSGRDGGMRGGCLIYGVIIISSVCGNGKTFMDFIFAESGMCTGFASKYTVSRLSLVLRGENKDTTPLREILCYVYTDLSMPTLP